MVGKNDRRAVDVTLRCRVCRC